MVDNTCEGYDAVGTHWRLKVAFADTWYPDDH